MKTTKTIVAVVMGLALSAAASQAALEPDFGSAGDSFIQFNGTSSTFEFDRSNQFQISLETGRNSPLNLYGGFLGGPYEHGIIAGGPFGNGQYAAVNQTLDLTFTFAGSGMNLAELTTGGGPYRALFAGRISVVPEAGTILAGAGALGFVLRAMVFRSRRSGVMRIG